MAAVRKPFVRSKPVHVAAPSGSRADAAAFLADLLDGTVRATTVVTVRTPAGTYVRLDYDDPEGRPGAGQGGGGTRRG